MRSPPEDGQTLRKPECGRTAVDADISLQIVEHRERSIGICIDVGRAQHVSQLDKRVVDPGTIELRLGGRGQSHEQDENG